MENVKIILDNGIEKEYEYAILTNEIYKTWSGMTSSDYKEYKGLRKESLRDNTYWFGWSCN